MNPEEVFTKQELNENIMSESKKDIPNRINNLSNVLTTLIKFQKCKG